MTDNTNSNCKPSCVSEKEILGLAWNYFQQHAQQRMSLFNFFVVFSVLMTTGLLSTFQEKYDAHFIGIAIGLMLSLISFVFWKIDERNKFLTKTGEDAIKEIEKRYLCCNCYPKPEIIQIFCREAMETNILKKDQKSNFIVFRPISISKSFNLLFLFFFIVGISGAVASTYYQFFYLQTSDTVTEQAKNPNNDTPNTLPSTQKVKVMKKQNVPPTPDKITTPKNIGNQFDALKKELQHIESEIKHSNNGNQISREQKNRLFEMLLAITETLLPFVSDSDSVARDLLGKFIGAASEEAGKNGTKLIFDWISRERFHFKNSQKYSPLVIRFDFGSSHIPTSGEIALDDLVKNEFDQYDKISIVGYADRVGRLERNYDLAKERANKVAEVLIDRGIKKSHLFIYAKKETNIPVPTINEVKEPENRRVEIYVN